MTSQLYLAQHFASQTLLSTLKAFKWYVRCILKLCVLYVIFFSFFFIVHSNVRGDVLSYSSW
jgi:hypothetical protein